jgi:hypothetical protein
LKDEDIVSIIIVKYVRGERFNTLGSRKNYRKSLRGFFLRMSPGKLQENSRKNNSLEYKPKKKRAIGMLATCSGPPSPHPVVNKEANTKGG